MKPPDPTVIVLSLLVSVLGVALAFVAIRSSSRAVDVRVTCEARP